MKIITIPESQLKDRENEEGVKEVGASRGREDGSSDDVTNTVASAVSKLIDKLLVSIISAKLVYFHPYCCQYVLLLRVMIIRCKRRGRNS